MYTERAFPIDGALEESAPALEHQLRAIGGMLSAEVDTQRRRVQLTFDADQICCGEIPSVLGACGCSPSNPLGVGDGP